MSIPGARDSSPLSTLESPNPEGLKTCAWSPRLEEGGHYVVLMQDILVSLMHDFKIFVNTHYLKIRGLRGIYFLLLLQSISRKKVFYFVQLPPISFTLCPAPVSKSQQLEIYVDLCRFCPVSVP